MEKEQNCAIPEIGIGPVIDELEMDPEIAPEPTVEESEVGPEQILEPTDR